MCMRTLVYIANLGFLLKFLEFFLLSVLDEFVINMFDGRRV